MKEIKSLMRSKAFPAFPREVQFPRIFPMQYISKMPGEHKKEKKKKKRIPPVIQQIFIEDLLCAKYFGRCCRHSGEVGKVPVLTVLTE